MVRQLDASTDVTVPDRRVVVIGYMLNSRLAARANQTKKDSERGRVARRLAVTGEDGELVAALTGIRPAEFYRQTQRFNLLDRCPGSDHGGTAFLAAAARLRAGALAYSLNGRFVVMLGGNVARAFGILPGDIPNWGEIWIHVLSGLPHAPTIEVLVLPDEMKKHAWFNKPENREIAMTGLQTMFARAFPAQTPTPNPYA